MYPLPKIQINVWPPYLKLLMCTKHLLSCVILFPKRWKIEYFWGIVEEVLHKKSYWTEKDSTDCEHLSKKPFHMCVSTEKSNQHLDVRGAEDGWLLVFRVWESSLTDTITSQQAHRFSLITPWSEPLALYPQMAVGIALHKFHPRPVSMSCCVCVVS